MLDDQSERHLVKLLADTSQPEIARATSAFYLGNIQTRNSIDGLLKALSDNEALVRYHALRSLENFPPELWQQKAFPSLADKVRAVRVAAADLVHRLPAASIPATYKEPYEKADAENISFLLNQTDFSVGNIMLADYKMQEGAFQDAISLYKRGLSKDSLMNYARLNLAAAYNTLGQNQEALKTLQDATLVDPFNDQVFYNLGLLFYELGDIPSSLLNFKKAEQLGSLNPGLYYNYGLALQQQGKITEAESILLKGFKLNPQATNVNYALTYLYIQQKLPLKARKHAEVLYDLDPQNPEYQEMFRNLGL